MADFEHLLKSYNVRDELDDIASADPPAYLKRAFAEGNSAAQLSPVRIRQLAVCAMVLDSVLNNRTYEAFEPELMADWRAHFAASFARLKESAVSALKRAQDSLHEDPDAAAELAELEQRLAPG